MNQYSSLYSKVNYTQPSLAVMNRFIREYDLSKANISALKEANIITEDQKNEFIQMPKMQREIIIGKMSRDKNILEVIKNGIINAKKILFEYNNIQSNEVLSIRNDAVFIIGRELSNIDFGIYKFICKNTYTTWLNLTKSLEFYYSDYYDEYGSMQVNISAKGIPDNKLEKHSNGMLQVLCNTCNMLQRSEIEDTIYYVSEILELYINRKLPIEYYRSFDSHSSYIVKSKFSTYFLDYINENVVYDYIDIETNLYILRRLLYITSSGYNR